MAFGGHRLVAQIGAGEDGIAYRGEAPDRSVVELRVLDGARSNPPRWAALKKRLGRAALLVHPAAVALRSLHLEQEPPFVVLEWVGEDLLTEKLPLSPEQAQAVALTLAKLLAAAHRLGLSHGHLIPEAVTLAETGLPKVDFTGLTVGRKAVAARAEETDPAVDVADLARILCRVLSGDSIGEARAGLVLPPGLPPALGPLLQSMLALDPWKRPTAGEVADRLPDVFSPHQVTVAVPPSSGAELAQTVGIPSSLAEQERNRERIKRLTQLGRFRLLEKLGEGGMGTVYRAEDTADGSIVAVKTLREVRGPEAVRRFHKEARLLAEVNNPYVTNLLEVNEDNGTPYLVLEYVAGRSLDRVLAERHRLPEKEALAIAADVARALAEAHARGIVHRDVKPDNVLLEVTPAGPRVKLSDFGLARHVIETESLQVTRAGTVLGTPMYVAPEQAAGGAIDVRADVYSLGATLFHLLAGRPPFQADTLFGLLALHQKEPPPPLQKLNPDVSEGACRVIEKALAKAPAARYPDAGAMLADLERLLRGEPTALVVHPRRPSCDPANVLRYEWVWDLAATPAQLWPHVSNTERLNRAVGLTAVRFTTRPAGAAEKPKIEDLGGGVRSEERGSRIEDGEKTTEDRGSRIEDGEQTEARKSPKASSSILDPPSSILDPPRSSSALRRRPRRFGAFQRAGIAVEWEEHPFEWIEARRMGVLREYSRGPFKWMMSVVELAPRGTGTTLTHRVEIEPRGVLGRTIAAVEVGVRGRRSVERVYRRIEAAVTGQATAPFGRGLVDPFEEPAAPTKAQRRRLEQALDELVARGVEPGVAEALGDFLAHAPAQEVARIRPLALAARLGLDPPAVVAACLHGARVGLLMLLWDVLCPACRIPTEIKETLRQLRDHERCEACNLDFRLDFANSVELIFRAHPEIRASELATYCIGGPAHSPHVVAQARLAPGERIELGLGLTEGTYRLRGPQLPYSLDFRVQSGTTAGRWEIDLAAGPDPRLPQVLQPGGQTFDLLNGHTEEVVVRVERTAPRADALTAARASSLALFREQFPEEVLAPGQLVSVATLTLLVTDLEDADRLYADLGDARAFAVLHEHFRLLSDSVRAQGGAVVKTVGEGLVAVFEDVLAAVRTGLSTYEVLSREEATRRLRLRVGIHRGPVQAATVNDQLDYFGTTVRQTGSLPGLIQGGEMVLSQAVAGEPQVAALLRSQGLTGELLEKDLPGGQPALLYKIQLSAR
jgi:serine/threonine protein kinase/class 3 adenylate cyclase